MSNRIREEFLQAKESVRLNKYLSEAGVCSRREADRLIESGKVTVDGVTAQMGMRVTAGQIVKVGKKTVSKQDEMIVLAVNTKTSTCGLHVHVNRTAFGSTREAQDECISRVLYFVEHHWLELLKFSRRTEYQMNRWAARYGYKNSPKEILEDAKKGCNGRYACVNITNYHTIEFRMFRGTLKYNTLIATLELVDKICELATDLTDTELKSVSWSDFVGSLDDSTESELITYLKERQLYINTPITSEEDD